MGSSPTAPTVSATSAGPCAVPSGRRRQSSTVGELLERWLAVASPDWSPKTVLETRRFFDRLLLPRFGALPLRKLTTSAIDRFYAELRTSGGVGGRPLAPASVRRIHVVLRRGLQQGVKWGWINVNPAANTTLPRIPRVDIHPPSPAQVAGLIRLAAEDEPELGTLLRVAAATGARRGEICALRWSDVDLEAGTVVIARSIIQGGEGLVEKETKTHGIRRIALDRGTLDELHQGCCLYAGTVRTDGGVHSPSGAGREQPRGRRRPSSRRPSRRGNRELVLSASSPGRRC